MGTIDISYTSLAIGLLLLLIPLFYLWKFRTGLLWVTVIGIARMIVQLFFIGIYMKYLFLWNNPWITNCLGTHPTETENTVHSYLHRLFM